MKKLLIALATTVALVGPAHAQTPQEEAKRQEEIREQQKQMRECKTHPYCKGITWKWIERHSNDECGWDLLREEGSALRPPTAEEFAHFKNVHG
jgi:hypothetical protein